MGQKLNLRDLIGTALGERSPDLVIRRAHLVNYFVSEFEDVDVVIAKDKVVALVDSGTAVIGDETQVVDADGAYLCAGLIDGHYHIGGTHLPVPELAGELLARGTTAIATDFYEIYTVAGPSGVRETMDQAKASGLKILFLPPVHLLGLEQFGTFGWDVGPKDMIEMLHWPECIGINEPPAAVVVDRNEEVLRVVEEAVSRGKVFAGHAPGTSGPDLQAYIGAGASSCHESQTQDEALEKLRRGMKTMMRQGSAAPDLLALIDLACRFPQSSRWMMLCSDEVDPKDLRETGHMDHKVRLAVDAGVDPIVALQMASLNVAEYYGVADQIGSVAPGKSADLVVTDDLKDFRARVVIADGAVTAQDGRPNQSRESAAASPRLKSRVFLNGSVDAGDFILRAPKRTDAEEIAVRVVGVSDGSLVSTALESTVPPIDGLLQGRLQEDVLPMAVLERHRASGRMGRAFVKGFGFKSGAVAMTYCHVYHNMLVVGAATEDMALAADALRELDGGIVVVNHGEVIARWSLPIVGVIGDRSLSEAYESFNGVNEAIKGLGCELTSPILALSFVALPTIPAYGLTDKGLYDVGKGDFVDVVIK
jgi:adenine deaminase